MSEKSSGPHLNFKSESFGISAAATFVSVTRSHAHTTLYSLGSKIEQTRQTPRLAGSLFFSFAQFDSSFLSSTAFLGELRTENIQGDKRRRGERKCGGKIYIPAN